MYGAVRKSYSLKFSCIKHLVFRFEMFYNQPRQRWWLVFSRSRFKGLYWIIINNQDDCFLQYLIRPCSHHTDANMNTYPICDSPLSRSARRSFAHLSQKSCLHNLYSVCVNRSPTRYGLVPVQKLSGSIVWTPIRYVTPQFRDRRGAASLHNTEIAPKSPLLCVNRSAQLGVVFVPV